MHVLKLIKKLNYSNWDVLRSVSVHFGSPSLKKSQTCPMGLQMGQIRGLASQNALKLILKSPRFAQFGPIWMQNFPSLHVICMTPDCNELRHSYLHNNPAAEITPVYTIN